KASLAQQASWLVHQVLLLDVVEIADESEWPPETVARVHFALAERLRIPELLSQAARLPQTDRWDALARAAVRGDVTATLANITRAVTAEATPGDDVAEILRTWEDNHPRAIARVDAALAEIAERKDAELAPLAVALRQLRGLVRGA
ncbi:MAG: NAD-glutamate dehydrogenase, partial [Bowdeniella nasicola]|nr:NAD-glutamate dehydrogenase [Bowdeniella nasicola]